MVTEKTDCDASDDDGQVDDAAILEAYCRAQIAELPRGPRGLKAAQALLKAIPDGYRLGLPDTTESARQLFRSLADAGLIAECPSDSDMPSALRLVASVCGLVTQRSQRRWTIWFARACDPDHPLGASVREAVTPAMLRRPSGLSKASETSQRNDLRRAHEEVKQERDELRRELEDMRYEHDALKQKLDRVTKDRDELKKSYGHLARTREDESQRYERVRQERDSLRADLEDMRKQQEALTKKSRLAREEVSETRAALKAMETEKSKLRTQLGKEQETSDHLRKARNGERDLREYVSGHLAITKELLTDIADTCGLEFNADDPGEFAGKVERVFTATKAHATHVASVCAKYLDRYLLRYLATAAMYQIVSERTPAADIELLFGQPSPKLLKQFTPHLNKLRADLKLKGVVLPPSVVSVEDIRYKAG